MDLVSCQKLLEYHQHLVKALGEGVGLTFYDTKVRTHWIRIPAVTK